VTSRNLTRRLERLEADILPVAEEEPMVLLDLGFENTHLTSTIPWSVEFQ
jgi:hypothetical protein